MIFIGAPQRGHLISGRGLRKAKCYVARPQTQIVAGSLA
jgi:hypothetical protein